MEPSRGAKLRYILLNDRNLSLGPYSNGSRQKNLATLFPFKDVPSFLGGIAREARSILLV